MHLFHTLIMYPLCGTVNPQPPHCDSTTQYSSTLHNLAYKGPTKEGHMGTSIASREIVTFTLLSNPKDPLLDMIYHYKFGPIHQHTHMPDGNTSAHMTKF